MIEIQAGITGNGFPVVDSNDVAGGIMFFPDKNSRDSVDSSFLKEGMVCCVGGEKYYRRVNNVWDEMIMVSAKQMNSILQRINLVELGIKIEKIELSDYSILLTEKETYKLLANTVPKLDNIGLIFSSEDPSIASVDQEGNITAESIGKTNIIVTTPNPHIKSSCAVHVSQSNIVGNDDIETDSLRCKLTNNLFGERAGYWLDASGNDFDAKLVNFTDTNPFVDNCIKLRGKEYLELSYELLSEGVSTIELYIDPLQDTFPEKKMLFAKKDSWNSMCYQVSNLDIMFGGINGIARIASIGEKDGLTLFTFTIDRLTNRIGIFIDGDFAEELIIEGDTKFGDNPTSKLLIGTHSEIDSSSNIDIYAVKIFNKILTNDEIKQEYNNIKI